MSVTVDEGIRAFLAERAGEVTAIEPLAGDASVRSYWRVTTSRESFVLCHDGAFEGAREGEYPFLAVHRLLRDIVPVPSVRALDVGRGLLLIEDLGDLLLEHAVPGMDEETVVRTYRTCLDNLFKIQSLRGKGGPFSLFFDVDKLMFEFDFFIEHALRGYWHASPGDGDMSDLRSAFLAIAGTLYRPDLFVLNHRDYHARNIILHRGVPCIIDFQDARMGLPQYDAVSLLRDSYITLAPGAYDRLLEYCREGGKDMGIHAMGNDEYNFYFDVMAFQRNVKALGTFGHQVTVRGNRRYERHIPPTVAYLGDYADRHECLGKAWRIIGRYCRTGAPA